VPGSARARAFHSQRRVLRQARSRTGRAILMEYTAKLKTAQAKPGRDRRGAARRERLRSICAPRQGGCGGKSGQRTAADSPKRRTAPRFASRPPDRSDLHRLKASSSGTSRRKTTRIGSTTPSTASLNDFSNWLDYCICVWSPVALTPSGWDAGSISIPRAMIRPAEALSSQARRGLPASTTPCPSGRRSTAVW